MNPASDRRKHSRTRKVAAQSVRVSFEERPGYPKTEIVTTLIDSSDGGCRIAISRPLGVGSLVYVDRQALFGGSKSEIWSARVTWCSLERDAGYTAGLNLESVVKSGGSADSKQARPQTTSLTDYYELLQVNPKADSETIHRVYRLLAQRFHPDNIDSGNELVFRRLLEAYRVLSDPEQRAAYDVHYLVENQLRWKIFDQTDAVDGRRSEKAKRTGILLVLYTRRRNEPTQPSMTIHEMEDLLGCPREHLEFSLWYLKERGHVTRSDNGRFTITANGVEAAEDAEIPWATREDRLLPSGTAP